MGSRRSAGKHDGPFHGREMDWSSLAIFFDEVFFPYMVGGIIPVFLLQRLPIS